MSICEYTSGCVPQSLTFLIIPASAYTPDAVWPIASPQTSLLAHSFAPAMAQFQRTESTCGNSAYTATPRLI